MINKDLLRKRFSKNFKTYCQQTPIQKQMAEFLINLVKQENLYYQNILEIGAGEGTLTRIITEQLNYNLLTVNDLCPEAKEFVTEIQPQIEFIAGDIEKISFEKKYDLIIANAVFQWLEDLELFLHNITNTLNNNGLLAFSTFGNQNLHEIKVISGQGLAYYSLTNLENILQKNFQILHSSEQYQQLNFVSALQVINHLRKSGVNAFSQIWTKSKLTNFCKEYEKKYLTDKGLTLTYHSQYFLLKYTPEDFQVSGSSITKDRH